MNIEINWLAVLLSGVGSMAVGFLWYSFLFTKPWIKLMGMTKESMKDAQKQMGPLYGLSFVLSLVTAYILAHVMFLSRNFLQAPAVETGLTTAFWMWLGFVMPVQATYVLFSGKKINSDAWKLFGINTGYQLVSLLVMGLILGILG